MAWQKKKLINKELNTLFVKPNVGCVSSIPTSWIGDSFCDDETNNAGCHFDGGDCCGTNANAHQYYYCNECICYCTHTSWIGDGFCDDVTNNADCNFDGGDCCGRNVNTQWCNECICY